MPFRNMSLIFLALIGLCMILSNRPLFIVATMPIVYTIHTYIAKRNTKQELQTKARIKDFIYMSLDSPMNPPSLQNWLKTTIGISQTYQRESSNPEPEMQNMENEFMILEKEMNLIHDKLALSLLATIGIPIIYFVQSIAIHDAFAFLPLTVAILFCLQQLLLPAYNPIGISDLLQKLTKEPPTDHESIIWYETLVNPWNIESSTYPTPNQNLTIPQEIVATLIESTWQIEPTQRKILIQRFIKEFFPMKHLENTYVATITANKIKKSFNLFATSTVLGILVSISRLISHFPGVITITIPHFLHITTGMTIAIGQPKMKAVSATILYFTVLFLFTLAFKSILIT